MNKSALPKIYLRQLAIIPVVLILMAGSFFAGDALHGDFSNPFVRTTQKLDFSGLNDIYGLMQRDFDGTITNQGAIDGAKAGLVSAGGDPYTTFLTAAQAKDLSDQLNGKLSGIGAQIGIKNNYLTVIAPIASSPAEKAGLRSGDIIAQINGETSAGLSVDTAVGKIRGKAGTTVTLKLVRGTTPAFDVTITRADISVPSVTWSLKSAKIGYIQISTFGSDTTSLIDKAAAELQSRGATKIILDLRNNGGGYLDAGVAVATEFLPQGKLIVEERTGGKSTNKNSSAGGGRLVGLPTIVLVNGGSASASEIVSGALHDNNVAKLVGEKTFGKGSVQEIKDLPGGAQIKITIAHWYTPAGININKEGIKPDVTIGLTTEDYNASRDPQLDKAIQLLQ